MRITRNFKYPGIIAEMARHGDTQKELGEKIGISREALRLKLIGKNKWTIDEIEKICKVYKKDYYELFKGE